MSIRVLIAILFAAHLWCPVTVRADATTTDPAIASRIEIRDGWYYVDGQRFFVNALGYEIGARPGQHPYRDRTSEPERVKRDMAVIREAGFNAIRTWSELSEEELKVVQASGLKIVFGIGMNPEEDFSDPAVVDRYLGIVRRVLAYSKNYESIITYLVMNEPMPRHIREVGAQATVDLWTRIRDLIHREHPGIPVTISGNSAITEFVDMNLFDVYGFNSYDYDGFNYTHGYANASRLIGQANGQGKPLLLTEFGLSVSRDHGEERYGGNTLMAQMEMLPWYYRQLLDAGAAGACPFYYADGWWKGQEPAVHNDTPEEWFGFWGYADGADTVGYPRPVWHAMKRYNNALISSPRNQAFYQNRVPLEIFLHEDVASLRVVYEDRVIYSRGDLEDGFFSDVIDVEGGLRDREFIFEFYDKDSELLKLEGIVVLTADKPVEWPTLTVRTPTDDLDDTDNVVIQVGLENDTPFTLGDEVRYLYSTHIGWSRGERRRWSTDPTKKTQAFVDIYRVPDESPVLGLYAGAEIRFGKFVRTIHDQHLVYRGDWADPIRIR